MASRPPTSRQQHWLDHLTAAEASGQRIADYARAQGFTPKQLYQWKTRLTALGHWKKSATDSLPQLLSSASAFVPVVGSKSRSGPTICRVILPNGVRIEVDGPLDTPSFTNLLAAAGALA